MSELTDEDVAALEQKIEESPDDTRLYRVYGDWLESQGDPRGALVALQAELARLTELERAAGELLRAHGDALLGPLAAAALEPESPLTVRWRCGFIESLSATLRAAGDAPTPAQLATLLAHALDHGSARFLLAVEVHASAPLDLAPVVVALAEHGKPACLRAVRLGAPDLRVMQLAGELPALGDAEPLLTRFPRLDELALHGHARLGRAHAPALARLALAACTTRTAASLAGADWPALHTLALGHAADPAWTASAMAELTLALTRTAPALRSLHLAGFPGSLARQVIASDLLPRLSSLALTWGSADEATIQALLAAPERLAHLRHLDVSQHTLSGATVAALQRLPIEVTVSQPRPHGATQDEALASELYCSFCGKSRQEVRSLIAGPQVFICDECVSLCHDIIDEGGS